MSRMIGLFNHAARLQMETLNQRLTRSRVITGNIANAETPGFRAIGYNFEKQLHSLSEVNEAQDMKTSDPRHLRNAFTSADAQIRPEVFVRPTESVSQDGNTVDVDDEMSKLAENQILYRAAVDFLNKKIGILRYAISGGTR